MKRIVLGLVVLSATALSLGAYVSYSSDAYSDTSYTPSSAQSQSNDVVSTPNILENEATLPATQTEIYDADFIDVLPVSCKPLAEMGAALKVISQCSNEHYELIHKLTADMLVP